MSIQLRRTISQLPGPKGLPILGNFLQLDLPKLHLILEEWSDRYGGIYKFKLLNKTVVAVSNPELVQCVLRDRPETYRRVSTIELAARELGTHGLFTTEGEQWRRERYVTMHAFKSEYLRRFFLNMLKITERLHKRWSASADACLSVDVQEDWMRFTIDNTTLFAFGYDINMVENESVNFQQHLERFRIGLNTRTGAPFPYWHYIKLPSDRALEKSLAILKETIAEFIQKTRQRLENDPELANQPSNFLEALLVTKDEKGNSFSYEEIQGNIFNILLAGEDTTARTLSWLLYFMAEHPEIQRKMQEEVDGNLLAEQIMPIDQNVIDKLHYIEAVAHETLRLKAVAPLLCMETNIDTELDGVLIPKGVPVMLLTRGGVLHEENFTDAHQFKPERWMETKPTGCAHNRNASLPFGAGPRSCPGRNLAMLEIKMAMAMVCKNFSVTRVDTGQPVQEVFSFTMMPDKLRVKFEKR
jgi:cytochrome P450